MLVPSVAICSPCSAALAWSSPFPSHYKPLLCQPQTQLLLFALLGPALSKIRAQDFCSWDKGFQALEWREPDSSSIQSFHLTPQTFKSFNIAFFFFLIFLCSLHLWYHVNGVLLLVRKLHQVQLRVHFSRRVGDGRRLVWGSACSPQGCCPVPLQCTQRVLGDGFPAPASSVGSQVLPCQTGLSLVLACCLLLF